MDIPLGGVHTFASTTMSKKRIKFGDTPESSDRKAMILADSHGRGELSDEEFFRNLEALCQEGRRGPYLEATYAAMYTALKGYDNSILGFIHSAVRKRPEHTALALVMSQAAEEFGLDALCLHFGTLGLSRLMNVDSREEISAIARASQLAARDISARGLSWSRDGELLVKLDYAMLESILGHEDKAKALADGVLAQRPLWLPALRVKASVAWDSFHPDIALETWEKAAGCGELAEYRAREALCLLIFGRDEEAAPILDALLARTSMEPDPFTLAELCIAAGRGAAGDGAFRSYIDDAIGSGQASDNFLHLAAGLALLAGDEERAQARWRLVRNEPMLSFAKVNLKDLEYPPERRRGPFLLRLVDMVPKACVASMKNLAMVQLWEVEDEIDRALGVLRSRGPELVRGIGRILIRYGDPQSLRNWLRRLICPWFPELDAWLLAELDAPQIHPGRRSFLRSELREARLALPDSREHEPMKILAWDVSWKAGMTRAAYNRQNVAAHACLESGNWKEAVAKYRELSELEPDEASGWNNLRYALSRLGETQEVERLGALMRERFPGYIHTQTEIAREFARTGQSERALRILEGLLTRESFHGTEFRALMETLIEVHLVREEPQEALLFYEIWEEHETEPKYLEPFANMKAAALLAKTVEAMKEKKKRGIERRWIRAEKAADSPPGDSPADPPLAPPLPKRPVRPAKRLPPEQPELF
jgi:tetratricopeptide (TPR) repeat protein